MNYFLKGMLNIFGNNTPKVKIMSDREAVASDWKAVGNDIKNTYKPSVTLGWDGKPTLERKDGTILPRAAEMIINRKYYPNGRIGEWLVDPDTNKKLPITEQ